MTQKKNAKPTTTTRQPTAKGKIIAKENSLVLPNIKQQRKEKIGFLSVDGGGWNRL